MSAEEQARVARDNDANVRQSILRVRRSEFLLHRDMVRGFVYDTDTHQLREVHPG